MTKFSSKSKNVVKGTITLIIAGKKPISRRKSFIWQNIFILFKTLLRAAKHIIDFLSLEIF